MSDILQEVDEALKQERMMKLWQTYGRYLIAALVLVVLMTAGKSWYEYNHRTKSEAATSQLISIIDGDESKRIVALEEFTKTEKSGGAVIGQLVLAGAHIENGNQAAAITVFEQITQAQSAPKYYLDLATLMQAQLQMDNLTEENTDKVFTLLTSLIDDETSEWRYHARLNRAVLYAAQDKYKEAIEDAAASISAPNMPPSFVQRATALEQLYTIKSEKTDS